MIVRDRPAGLALFIILRGSILSRIWKVLLTNILIALAVTFGHGTLFHYKVTLTTIPFSLIGLALAIFLGFRNNAAYDRFWESRKLWGQLIAACRDLARQSHSLIRHDTPLRPDSGLHDLRRRMLYRAIAFAHALRLRLRDVTATDEFEGLLWDEERAAMARATSGTNFLLRRMGEEVRTCLADGRLESCLAPMIEATLSSMNAVATGCERIKTTPIPFSYTLLLHRTAYLYCFLLPFGLVDSIGFMTPVVVAIVAYTFFGLDAAGDEIEEPFGEQTNQLALNALCRTIEIDLREALGETDLPLPLQPVNFQLT